MRVEGKASLEKEEFKIQKNLGSIMKGPSPKVAEERGDKIDAQVREGSSGQEGYSFARPALLCRKPLLAMSDSTLHGFSSLVNACSDGAKLSSTSFLN